ncbi:MAG: WD repeat-containing protein jip5 [Icmadophila ericetorum]|nr:WD repeat-containing protein jip5 [Icmadophila ericetorum]
MFENLCTLPLASEFFSQATHPTEPLFAVGLASGHVQTYKLPPSDNSASTNGATITTNGPGKLKRNGNEKGHSIGTIDSVWKTKRHKGSCRSLSYGLDGLSLYSAGTDGIVKVADVHTGQVSSKIAIPQHRQQPDPPSLLHALTPQSLLLATDSSALHIYDLRSPTNSPTTAKPTSTYYPHEDYISSLTPLPPTSESTSGFPKQWVSTGGTTLAVTDLRRGVLVKSEDQEEELLSSVFVEKGAGKGKGKCVVGDSSGVLTLWEKGVWEDQDERIIVDREGKESLDVLATVPEEFVGIGGGLIAVGMGDGRISIVQLGNNKVVSQLQHDDVDSVLGLDFAVGGRMVSGGGMKIKVWGESVKEESDDDSSDDEREMKKDGGDDDEDSNEDEGEISGTTLKKRRKEDNDDASDREREEEEEEQSSSEEEERKRRKKKRKRGSGKGGGVKPVLGFKGLD